MKTQGRSGTKDWSLAGPLFHSELEGEVFTWAKMAGLTEGLRELVWSLLVSASLLVI